MLVWKSSECSLRKYIVLCTHIIVILDVTPSQKWRKTQKTLIFHFVPFSAPPCCTKALLIYLENGFSHSIPSMFHVFQKQRHLDQASSGVMRWGPKFWKIFRDPVLALFQYFKWNIFFDSKRSGNNFGWSSHSFW